MYRITFSKPGQPPYCIIYHRHGGLYGQGEIAPLGGHFEILRGDFCGSGEIQISDKTTDMAIGDWVRVYLDSPEPIYLGFIASELRGKPPYTVALAALTDRISKARWSGMIEATFKDYVLYALGHAVLPPGISIGDVPSNSATLKANTVFELLGDTMQAALPVINGATWGVTAGAKVAVATPSDILTHRFVRTESETPAGNADGYANAVRFPFKTPAGDDQWFEGRIESEISKYGEVWEVTQSPTPATSQPFNALLGYASDVTYTLVSGPNFDISATRVRNLKWGDALWTGKLLDAAGPIAWQAGSDFHPATAEQSELTFPLGGVFYHDGGGKISATAEVEIDAGSHTVNTIGQVLDISGPPDTYGGFTNSATPGVIIYWVSNNSGTVGGTVSIRYKQPYIDSDSPAGLRLRLPISYKARWHDGTEPTYDYDKTWIKREVEEKKYRLTFWAKLGDSPTRLQPDITIYNTTQGTTETHVKTWSVTPYQLDIPIKPAITLRTGSVIKIAAEAGASGTLKAFSGASEVTVSAQGQADGTLNFGYSGVDISIDKLTLTGTLNKLGAISADVFNPESLAAYAYGLLRYRVQPVRSWRGFYNELKHVPAHGMARFDTPDGDIDLDVQRVSYDLNDGKVTVEAGTPMAATDEDAAAEAFEGIRREARMAGSTQ